MREESYTKLTCDMCGEEAFVEQEYRKVTGDGWMYVCGKMLDFCPTCAGKINGFVVRQAEERRKHGTLVEVDEAEVQKQNQAEHGRMVEKRPDGSCTYADGAVSVRCAICGYEACVKDPCDLTEQMGWLTFAGDTELHLCHDPDCDCAFWVKEFIRTETTGNLAHMKKTLERFMSSTPNY